MQKNEAAIQIKKLREKINKLNYEYFVLDTSTVSEEVRDALKRELKELENQYPDQITSDSPTQRVGSALSGRFKKMKHITPKKSLQDAFSIGDLEDWAQRIAKLVPGEKIQYLCELKIDGLNITLHYEKGHLKNALTRGNGLEGELVTHTVRTIESIPLVLMEPVDLEVSGEIFLPKKSFEKVNKEQKKQGLEPFANPRNAAAGSIRQLDPRVSASRDLSAFFYEIGKNNIRAKTNESVSKEIKTQKDALEIMQALGLPVNKKFIQLDSIKEVAEYCQKWHEKRKEMPYEIDGIVMKVNELAQQKKMGSTAKAPRYALAYKFPAQQATSKILDIMIQVGRTGALTPVAVLKPTFVAGSMISRATLHNQDEITRLDIRINDTVIIQKAGDVIPEVVESLKDLRTGNEKRFTMPSQCPICGAKVIRKEGEAIHRCSNPKCFAIEIEKLKHFISRSAFNIDGLGEKVIDQLVENDLIRDSADIFSLKKFDLLQLPLFKGKRATKILFAIENAKIIPLSRFIFALGIRYVGEQTSQDLADYLEAKMQKHKKSAKIPEKTVPQEYYELQDIIHGMEAMTFEEYESVEGIGEKVAQSLYEWMRDSNNQKLLKKFEAAGMKVQAQNVKKRSLEGKSFVLTGTLEKMTREEAKTLIKKSGGKMQSSISKKTDYLVVGKNPGSKYLKAKKLKIALLTEEDLEKLLQNLPT